MYHLILVNISGYTEGSTEVQRFTSIGVNNFAYNYNVTLAHTSVIYVTIIGLFYVCFCIEMLEILPQYNSYIIQSIYSYLFHHSQI
jgi:hypothetical protein